jgi:hypothetical protein
LEFSIDEFALVVERKETMKRALNVLTAMAIALALFVQPGSAGAGGGQEFRFRGRNAVANFSSVDESGCIVTDVYLWGSEEVVSDEPGQPAPSSEAYVLISRYDSCTGDQLLLADGTAVLSVEDFQVGRTLSWATLHTPITVFDYESGNWFEVVLDISWTASSAVTRLNDHNISHTPGCLINSRRHGELRLAEVSGSVSDGWTNYTPEPSSLGTINSLISGTVVIDCN